MDVQSSVNHVVVKKLWNMVRLAFFMLRKGGVLKKKMMLDMVKRWKVVGKTLATSLMFHHSHGKGHHYSTGFGLKEYEFSCSNSPAPAPLSFHMGKKKHHYFPSIPRLPCIQPHSADEEEDCYSNAIVISAQSEYFAENNDLSDLPAMGESAPLSPYCVRSNFSSCGEEQTVDREAEEFISKFYEQMRLQRQVSFLQYDEMLARGTG